MLDSLRLLFLFKTIDKLIMDRNYDLAMTRLNSLIEEGYKPSEVFLKRGQLCHKLLMLDDAYSDFTYIISHCADKINAYFERAQLNFEISNYYEAIIDADRVLAQYPENFNLKRIKFLSYAYSDNADKAKEYVLDLFENNKYKTIQFIFNETAQSIAEDDLSKALKLLVVIDLIDPGNPIKILKEANIYGLAGDKNKESELMTRLASVFPKYFISHFRFTDLYEEKDLLETCFLLELKIFDKQKVFEYPMCILEGYRNNLEGHIIDSKECFERAIEINPNKPEAYVLLAETLQLMSGYNNPELKLDAEQNYRKALELYEAQNLVLRAEEMKRQIKHLNSSISLI